MIQTTFIARSSDGLLLSENYDKNTQELLVAKRKIKMFLKIGNFKYETSDIRCIDVDHFVLYLKSYDGVLYMSLCDKRYPVKLANSYLDDLYGEFREEVKRHFGTQAVDYRSKIEMIEEPYYFLKFDKVINKRRQEYQDAGSESNMARVKSDLLNIQSVMRDNLDIILTRGESLREMTQKSSKLKNTSIDFKKKSMKLELNLWLRKYMAFLISIMVIFFYLSWKLF